MSNLKVDISSYNSFRAATIGKSFDVDRSYGSQCYDGAALLWYNLTPSRMLNSGKEELTINMSGTARGTFQVLSARNINAGTEFDIITDITKIKRGDVIVYGTGLGQYGHIGFADEDYAVPQIATYGQNQGSGDGQGIDDGFTVKKYNSAAIIGAFRYKAWNSQNNTPTINPDTVLAAGKTDDELAAQVGLGLWGNGDERKNRLTGVGRDAALIQKIYNASRTASNQNTFKEYKVKITASMLNVRKGPGVNTKVEKVLSNDKSIHIIIDEANGPTTDGSIIKWGKLKSGAGYIALPYTIKV